MATQQQEEQIRYYRESVDAEEEIARPRCYSRPVRFLLDFKLRTALEMAIRHLPGGSGHGKTAVVVCWGSGMESEFLWQQGLKVVATDLSLEALQRAPPARQPLWRPLRTGGGRRREAPVCSRRLPGGFRA
jgi:hypothetical protein